jgi:hypothetical protein
LPSSSVADDAATPVGAANLLGGNRHGDVMLGSEGNLRFGLPDWTVASIIYLLAGIVLETYPPRRSWRHGGIGTSHRIDRIVVSSGRTPNLGLLVRTMVASGATLPSGGIIFGACAGWRGPEVVLHGFCRVDDSGSRWLTRADLRMQCGDAVWSRDGVDRRPGEDLFVNLHLGDGLAEDGGVDLWSVSIRCSL